MAEQAHPNLHPNPPPSNANAPHGPASTQPGAHSGPPRGGAPTHHGRMDVAKTNMAYLALGSKAGSKPNSVATRGLLTTTRYILRYVIHRLMRVAKYAAIGAAVAFVGTGVLGAVGSGVAWFMAPGIGMGMGVGMVWACVKFTWRHRPERFRGGWWSEMERRAQEGRDPGTDEKADAEISEAAQREENRRVRQDVWMRV